MPLSRAVCPTVPTGIVTPGLKVEIDISTLENPNPRFAIILPVVSGNDFRYIADSEVANLTGDRVVSLACIRERLLPVVVVLEIYDILLC